MEEKCAEAPAREGLLSGGGRVEVNVESSPCEAKNYHPKPFL